MSFNPCPANLATVFLISNSGFVDDFIDLSRSLKFKEKSTN